MSRSTQFRRTLVRASAVVLGTVSAVAVSSPAMALMRDDGDEPGTGLSVLQTLGLFVGIPAGLVALITFCVFIPEIVAGASVRPGLTGPVEPVWINGPTGSQVTEALSPPPGGAAPPESARHPGAPGTMIGGPTTGGASARW